MENPGSFGGSSFENNYEPVNNKVIRDWQSSQMLYPSGKSCSKITSFTVPQKDIETP